MMRRVLAVDSVVPQRFARFCPTASTTLARRVNEFTVAFDARDAARVASLYAEDAVVLGQGTPMRKGRAVIQRNFELLFKTDRVVTITNLEVYANGDIGYQVGTALSEGTNGGALAGKFVTIWKISQGEWRIAYDMFNADHAVP
jgi:ketosteroid isomerase-like protein